MIIDINKDLKKPLYKQIAEAIEIQINQGTLQPGTRLPTEKELCDAYDISHSVVLNAYQWLSQKELIERIKGQGTYVKNHFKVTLSLEALFNLVIDHASYQLTKVFQETISDTQIYDIVSSNVRSEYRVLSQDDTVFALIKIYLDETLVEESSSLHHLKDQIKNQSLHIESWFQSINIQSPNLFFFNETKSIPGYLITSEIKKDNTVKGIIKAFFHGKIVKVVEPREIIQL